ncbi:hypothetical protein D6D19_04866 [Aureobasidium pullulans]|uniref:BTB domain-containing protein n=1 Tax=Aureobasidium pullulans TaxID=5580 RepID=A0A4S9LTA2_AURPU|nr:hypothetical protein D6D19_04866 [Aureobasidium pullulans]THY33151.1 hypothetical protein D6D00_01215 [Aureobasidium pullulans]TIA03610.1 hypothetical protein D6C82_01695 [Aureobasidium pullulans]
MTGHAAFARKFYNNPSTSDVTLTFGEERIHAHLDLLDEFSPVFRAAFTGDRFANAVTRDYAIQGYPQKVIHSMIRYVYGFELGLGEETTSEEDADFLLNVYLIGNEYQIQPLQAAAANLFEALLERVFYRDECQFKGIIETLLSFYKENELDEDLRGHWKGSTDYTLLGTVARFCDDRSS